MKRWLITALLALLAACNNPAAGGASGGKKLIKTGWDQPGTAFLKANLARMQDSPFDGLVIRPGTRPEVFTKTPYPEAEFAKDRENLKGLEWGRFTDNYLLVWSGIEADWDWFDDTHWAASEQNLRGLARTAKAGGLKGILFDMEPYSGNPWDYAQQPARGRHGFAQFRAKVRERGERFMRVLQEEHPGAAVFAYFLLTGADGVLEPGISHEEAQKRLEADHSGLWPSFVNGMLSAAPAGVRLVEGNEAAYYYLRAEQFEQANRYVRGDLATLVEPALRGKYQAQVQTAHSVYGDGVMNLWRTPRFCGFFFESDADRLKMLEHNVYHALRAADTYAWFYDENPDWWGTKGGGVKVPQGLREAVQRAKDKTLRAEPLGLDTGFVEKARQACDAKVSVGGDLAQGGRGVEGIGFEVIYGGKTYGPEDQPFCATWNASRRYSCVFPGGSSFTVTPRKSGASFSPPSRTYTDLDKSDWNANFSASP